MTPPYGSPAWLILTLIEDGGSCPVAADQLWRGLAAPATSRDCARWSLAEHAQLIEQLVVARHIVRLPDGRLVGSQVALLSQLREAA